MENGNREKVRALTGADSSDVNLLHSLSGQLLSALPRILDAFYGRLRQQSWAHQYIETPQEWRRHRDALRGWVVAVLTQVDLEIEDLMPRVADVHANLEINICWVMAAAAYLKNLVINELSASHQWSLLVLSALERRWSYALALQVGAYEDRWKENLLQKNDELQRAIDERDQRVREVAGLNNILQRMMSRVPLEPAENLEAVKIVQTIGRLLGPEGNGMPGNAVATD